jgi:hypothetical protein
MYGRYRETQQVVAVPVHRAAAHASTPPRGTRRAFVARRGAQTGYLPGFPAERNPLPRNGLSVQVFNRLRADMDNARVQSDRLRYGQHSTRAACSRRVRPVRQEVVLRIDRAVAEDLAAMLHDTDGPIAVGGAVAAVSAVEAEGFDVLLHELDHALGRSCVPGCERSTPGTPLRQ